MQRQLNLQIDIANKAIVSSGDNGFYIGDSNKIVIELSQAGDYIVVVNALIPAGPVVSTGAKKQEDGTYLIDELDAFLMKVGTVKAQIVVSLGEERLTVNEFEFESLLAFGQSNMAVSPDVQSLNEFYAALHVLEQIDMEQLEEALVVINGLDIEQLKEIQQMAEEIVLVLDEAKKQSEELGTLIDTVQSKLDNGEFDGQDGSDGFSPIVETSKTGTTTTIKITDATGTKTATVEDGPQGPQGPAGDDYVLTEADKQEIENNVEANVKKYVDDNILGGVS